MDASGGTLLVAHGGTSWRHMRLSPCQIKDGVLGETRTECLFSRLQYALVLRFLFFNATDRTPHFVNRHANEDSARLACHVVAREFRCRKDRVPPERGRVATHLRSALRF